MSSEAAPTGPKAAPRAEGSARTSAGAFVVYVEGPRDRDLLQSWARAAAPRLVRPLVRATVILGGRQPARAARHLRRLRESEPPPAEGICILDRDGMPAPEPDAEPGLELFTWARRHIESYLLVPEAIRRGHRVRDPDGSVARRLRDELPTAEDEGLLRRIDAKRLLGRKGPVSRALGRPVAPGRIARAMRAEEIHADVYALLERIGAGLGVDEATRSAPVVTVRVGLEGPSG